MNDFELSVSLDNCHHWGVWEGLRELFQNAIDNPEGFQVSWVNDTLTISNPRTVLDRKVLLTGYSGKRGDNSSIGRFGEGLLAGIGVLLRECCNVQIHNGDFIWDFGVRNSITYQEDVIFVDEEESVLPSDDYKVIVDGVSKEDYDIAVSRILQLQEGYTAHQTTKGEVLTDENQKGKIYVGGVWVATYSEFNYGYNFKPQHLPLDRDRNSVRSWDVKWETGTMLREVEADLNPHEIADMVVDKASDIQYNYSTPLDSKVADICFDKEYATKYGGKMLADSAEDAVLLQDEGHTNVVYIGNDKLTQVIKSSEGYQQLNFGSTTVKSIDDLLEDFKDKWYDEFSTDMLTAFEDMQAKINKR